MKKLAYIFIFFISTSLNGQYNIDLEENIVPNPSFETYSGIPIGWFYNGKHFTSLMQYWDAATTASPDVFGRNINVPEYWKKHGFGDIKPYHGECMVGITAYGCTDGKPHCREYIQVRLIEPMVKGQKYLVEFESAHLPKSYQINNLGALFSKTPIKQLTDGPLNLEPQVKSKELMKIEEKKWNTFSQTFIAEEEYEFLIIGNFNDDASTNFESPEHTDLKYAYYYIDDVLVKKVPPFIDVPEAPNPFEDVLLKKGEIIQLENIYFDIDRADFLPRSFPELEKLIDLLKSKPTMVIEIHGHTDNIGDAEYNAKLSLSRAQAVADYLSTHQISYTRTSYKGFGSTKPIASNETAEGRRANRRVEFLIIKE